jgi:hypothetical protein
MPDVLTAGPRKQWRVEENNGYILLNVCGTIILVIIKITVIIYTIGYPSTVMERTSKNAEYVICFVPYV